MGRAHYPAWYFNIKAHPEAECNIGGVTKHYVGHEVEGEEYDGYRQTALDTFIGFRKYYERLGNSRPLPIFVMRPKY